MLTRIVPLPPVRPASWNGQSEDCNRSLDWTQIVLILRFKFLFPVSLLCQCLVDQMRRTMLPLYSPASLRPPKPFAMTGPVMASRMQKEPMPNMIRMSRKKIDESTGMLASLAWCFRHLVAMVAFRLHCLVPHFLLMFCVQIMTNFQADYFQTEP